MNDFKNQNLGFPLISNSVKEMHRRQLFNSHVGLQTFVCKYVLLPTFGIFLGTYLLTPTWQNGVLLSAFFIFSACWLYGRHLTKNEKKLNLSVAWFAAPVIGFEFVACLIMEGNNPSALLACVISIIYCSLFSKKHLVISTIATGLAYMLAMVSYALNLIPQQEMSGLNLVLYDGAFVALLLPIASVTLWRSFSMKDELVEQMSLLNARQKEIIQTAQTVTLVIDEVVQNLHGFSNSFSAQASQQASAISESGATLEQIGKIASNTAQAALQTKEVAHQTRSHSLLTIERLKKVKSGFDKVIGTNESAQTDFAKLAQNAENIDEVLRANRKIAAQIKILAVNAGIQAAKAGDYGIGFQVVAKELKAMILSTDQSLEDSRVLLESIQNKARRSAQSIQSNSLLLLEHYDALGSTGKLIEEISDNMTSTTEQFEDIASSAKEQQTGLTEMNIGMNQIETSASNLSNQAHRLLESVSKLAKSQKSLRQVLASD